MHWKALISLSPSIASYSSTSISNNITIVLISTLKPPYLHISNLQSPVLSRASGEFEKPLAIAASQGHVHVMRALFEAGAHVNAFDRRGRTALHKASSKGKTEACKFLIDSGAQMFEGDFTGNTPLHLCAFNNHSETTGYLSFKGQEHTRTVTSDKQRPKGTMTFNQLTAVVFDGIMKVKLSNADVRA